MGEDKVQSQAAQRQSVTSELGRIAWFNINDKMALHLRARLENNNQQATSLNDQVLVRRGTLRQAVAYEESSEEEGLDNAFPTV